MQVTVPLRARPVGALRPPASLTLAVRRLALGVLVAALLLVDGRPARELRIHRLAGQHSFGLVEWTVAELGERAGRIGRALLGRGEGIGPDDRAAVAAYFAADRDGRHGLRAQTESAIERGLAVLLEAEGLAVSMALAPDGDVVFPPVSFSFMAPPQILIVSPRDRIAVEQSEVLRPDVTTGQAETLERAVDGTGVSSLVVPIGGLATFPTMVLEGTRPRDALVAVAHEWVHGYFFFAPLGRAYWSSQAARAINETAAELAGRELGDRLARDLGLPPAPRPRSAPSAEAPAESPQAAAPDARAMLRETRVRVDALLAAGQVEEAEAYMRERRDQLAAAGHDVRKLNQAYFAFYGSYGEAASGSSPLPGRLRRLREASPSFGAFLRRVSELTTADDLARAVGDR
jgi:hypothetical protein